MGSSLLDQLGQLHIVRATVAADGESMTCNDESASIATNGTGDFTITFGEPFIAAPIVVATVNDATYAAATDGVYVAEVNAVSTTSVDITTAKSGDADADGAAEDAICYVLIVGLRDN